MKLSQLFKGQQKEIATQAVKMKESTLPVLIPEGDLVPSQYRYPSDFLKYSEIIKKRFKAFPEGVLDSGNANFLDVAIDQVALQALNSLDYQRMAHQEVIEKLVACHKSRHEEFKSHLVEVKRQLAEQEQEVKIAKQALETHMPEKEYKL